VTLHHPESPRGETTLSSGGAIPLAQAYELDDAPRFERFFFVSGEGVDVGRVSQALVTLGRSQTPETSQLKLPEGWHQVSLFLRKE
jgi:hypothetical protein